MPGKVENVSVSGETTLGRPRGQERFRVIALAAGILILVGVYFGMRSSTTESGTLLPYQMLKRDLVSGDQAMFDVLKQVLADAEGIRASTARWPDAPARRSDRGAPTSEDKDKGKR